MIKLVLSDLDGTLFDNLKNISNLNKEAINKLTNLGIHFVLATGRPIEGVRPINKELNLDSSLTICYNGSLIIDNKTEKVLYKSTISGKVVKELYKESLRLNTYFHFFNEEGKLFTTKENEYTEVEERINHIKAKVIDIKDIKDNDKFLKAMLVGSDEVITNAYNEVKMLDGINKVRSSKIFLEFLNINSSKGDALNFIKNYYNLKESETLAIGDANNDISMLKNAYIGVAMKNSFDEVFKYASFITKSNLESGVAYAINELILNKIEGKN